MNTIDLVFDFHEKFKVGPDDVEDLRASLILEEANEFWDAAYDRDRRGQLDALLDLQYVLDGALIALGFNKIKNPDGTYETVGFQEVKDRAFSEVHRSNMSKLGPDGEPLFRDDGKILKGPNYSPPNLLPFV